MQAALKKGNFFQHVVGVNRMSHLPSRARRPLCLSASSFFFFHSAYFCCKFTLSQFSVSLRRPARRLNGSHVMATIQVQSGSLWIPAGLFVATVSCTRPQEEITHQRCHVKKTETDATNQKAPPPHGCVCHRTFQLDTRWCGLRFAITALLVILARCYSNHKENNHAIVCCFVFILINVIPSSVCPHVCSIHLRVYYLIFTLFIEAIT